MQPLVDDAPDGGFERVLELLLLRRRVAVNDAVIDAIIDYDEVAASQFEVRCGHFVVDVVVIAAKYVRCPRNGGPAPSMGDELDRARVGQFAKEAKEKEGPAAV